MRCKIIKNKKIKCKIIWHEEDFIAAMDFDQGAQIEQTGKCSFTKEYLLEQLDKTSYFNIMNGFLTIHYFNSKKSRFEYIELENSKFIYCKKKSKKQNAIDFLDKLDN